MGRGSSVKNSRCRGFRCGRGNACIYFVSSRSVGIHQFIRMERKRKELKAFFTHPVTITFIKIIVSSVLITGIIYYIDFQALTISFLNADTLMLSAGISRDASVGRPFLPLEIFTASRKCRYLQSGGLHFAVRRIHGGILHSRPNWGNLQGVSQVIRRWIGHTSSESRSWIRSIG